MYSVFEPPAEFAELRSRAEQLLSELLLQIKPSEKFRIPGSEELFGSDERGNCFFVLTEGMLPYRRNGKLLFYYDTGDFLGLEGLCSFGDVSLNCEFSVEVACYPKDDFLRQCRASAQLQQLWEQYLGAQCGLLLCLLSGAIIENEDFAPQIRTFEEGARIIEQGTDGDLVYTLLEGSADVFVDDVKVGAIKGNEIFGAIAALTNAKRTASVIAGKHCITLTLPKESFVKMISCRPVTVLKLMEDMARAITSLNQQVVELKLQKTVLTF